MTNHTPDDRVPLKLWLGLLRSTRLIENEIRGKLRDRYGQSITLPRFDVMAQLYREIDGEPTSVPRRMGELSQQLLVTCGNITGIVDQLVKEKMVERTADPNDGRAFVVRLTPAGLATFQAMAAEHRAWVADLTAGLTTAEQQELTNLLLKLRAPLQEHHPAETEAV